MYNILPHSITFAKLCKTSTGLDVTNSFLCNQLYERLHLVLIVEINHHCAVAKSQGAYLETQQREQDIEAGEKLGELGAVMPPA